MLYNYILYHLNFCEIIIANQSTTKQPGKDLN